MNLKRNINRFFNKFDEKFTSQFGCRVNDVTFTKLVEYLYTPKDSSSLAVTRILFGLAMLVDIPDERGGANIARRWGDQKICHFPLLPFLQGLPMPCMGLVYASLWIGALGVMLGYKYRTSAVIFAVCYWYLFLIEKSFWNNHSYLFGLVATLLIGTKANCYWSLDALFNASHFSYSVPYWNYFVLKYQFFILYFMAGLKKGTAEWLTGYSLPNLSTHWVFTPFRLFLTVDQTDYLIVHWFAFLFDLTVAFWLMWGRTRNLAMVFCAAFHLMNIRLFRIGMFPWVCLATMPLFYPFDWPKRVLNRWIEIKHVIYKRIFNKNDELNSEKCDDSEGKINADDGNGIKEDIGPIDEELNEKNTDTTEDINNKTKEIDALSEKNDQEESAGVEFHQNPLRRKVTVCLIIFYMALQAFLPYSHFLTKGYNNWTPGLYGYSWDMMVHTWDVHSVVVKVVDNDRQRDFYVEPYALTLGDRWTRHGDMVWQFARCLERNMKKNPDQELKNISVYVDVWCSLNGRFQQRMFDHRVDLLKAPWSPFEEVQWLMPLLSDAESWRRTLDELRAHVHSWNNHSDVIFFADFPGNHLENYLSPELANVTLTVLEGTVAFEPAVSKNSKGQTYLRQSGDVTRVASGTFHKVINVGVAPAFYMYTFFNKTEAESAAETEDKPLLPLTSELGRRWANALTFFDVVLSSLFRCFFGCQCQY